MSCPKTSLYLSKPMLLSPPHPYQQYHFSISKKKSPSVSLSYLQGPVLGQLISNMISPKKLIKMARKLHEVAFKGKKRISSMKNVDADINAERCSTSYVADKGHFVIYSSDQKRFVLPLAYLHNNIFGELLKICEEEFGLSSGGPIRLPCDSIFLNYIISFIQQHGVAADLEKALLTSIATTCRCSSSISFQHCHDSQQQLLCGY